MEKMKEDQKKRRICIQKSHQTQNWQPQYIVKTLIKGRESLKQITLTLKVTLKDIIEFLFC